MNRVAIPSRRSRKRRLGLTTLVVRSVLGDDAPAGPREDPAFVAFVATFPCMISGQRQVTIHHVRRCGESRNDRRIVPLAAEYHLIQQGPETSIEALGKEKFEFRYGVDLEGAIVYYNQEYERRNA